MCVCVHVYVRVCLYGMPQFESQINCSNPSAGDVRGVGSIPGQEDALEEGMATHPSILACSISWTEEPEGL